MGLKFDKIKYMFKYIISKKNLIQVYFIFFIFLNIIDFFNIISNDLDFFKKILSWILIGYVFYNVSITKIFIGTRNKFYDLMFIFSFCLMTIVRSLVLYLKINRESNSTFPIFGWFLNLFPATSTFVVSCFLIGLISTIILTITLLNQNKIKERSFLGSFNFKNEYFRNLLNYFLGIFFLIFFCLTVFNFFMEWFALAVDSLILVIGIIYYLFVYISSHTTSRFSSVLKNISNSGNEFYYNLIEKFSNKRTFFVGVSFLLTVHLIVDIGVYLVPYLVGTQNALYFDSLSQMGRGHTSMFSLLDVTSSSLYIDLTNPNLYNNNGSMFDNFLLKFGIVLVYVLNYFFIFCLMFLPFWIFYQNINKREIRFNRVFSILFLSALILNSTLFIMPKILDSNSEFKSITMPLNIDKSDSARVKGVDIYVNNIDGNVSIVSVLSLILIYFVSFIFLFFRYDKYKIYFDKLIIIFVLTFFIYYIFLFFTSILTNENYINNQDYLNYNKNYLHSDFKENLSFKTQDGVNSNVVLFSIYSDDNNHKDFIMYNFSNFDYNKYYLKVDSISLENNFDSRLKVDYISVLDLEKKVVDANDKKWNTIYMLETDFKIIKPLGTNYLKLNKVSEKTIYRARGQEIPEFLFVKQIDGVNSKVYLFKLFLFLDLIRNYFLSMFYIFGLLGFIAYYVRRNVFDI